MQNRLESGKTKAAKEKKGGGQAAAHLVLEGGCIQRINGTPRVLVLAAGHAGLRQARTLTQPLQLAGQRIAVAL